MSHFSKVDVEIKDIEALENAVKSMGFELEHDARCRYYYGSEQMEHVIKLPGKYDCGLVKNGDSYSLNYDHWDGHVERQIGKNGRILLLNYSKAKIEREARRLRYKCIAKGEKVLVYNPQDTTQQLEVTFDNNGNASMQVKGFKGKGCMIFSDLEKALGVVKEHRKNAEYNAVAKKDIKNTIKQKR